MALNWFITGISRGLGRELARTALDDGDVVVGTSRGGEDDLGAAPDKLHSLSLDVTDPEGPAEVFEQALGLVGTIDVVVNNAGYGLLGAIEESSEQEVAEILDTNLRGPIRVIRAALPHLRAQRRGHIVNVSSIAALDPLPGSGVYAVAKSGLSALSESLAAEVGALGLRVTSVEPGGFRTEFLSASSIRRTQETIADYQQTSGGAVEEIARHAGRQAGDPARGARLIIDAVRSDDPPLHLVMGADALSRTRGRTERLLADLQQWEQRSTATAFLD